VTVRTGRGSRLSAPERREQLLDVTKAIAAERGFHAVSIEAVAREAGISRPIVYEHFNDLGGLLEALVDREGARALGQLAEVLPRRLDDPREALLEALRGYLRAVESDPATWRLVLMPPEGAPALLRERISLGRGAVVGQLAEAVGPGLGPGRESPDPELTARALSAIADEAARLLLTDPAGYPVERILAHAAWLLGQLPGR
jgi:AcrR family transcriptional regulator